MLHRIERSPVRAGLITFLRRGGEDKSHKRVIGVVSVGGWIQVGEYSHVCGHVEMAEHGNNWKDIGA